MGKIAYSVRFVIVIMLLTATLACRREYSPPPQKPIPPTLDIQIPHGPIARTKEQAVSFVETTVPDGVTAVALSGRVESEVEHGPVFVAFEENRQGAIINAQSGVSLLDHTDAGKLYRVLIDRLPKPGLYRVVVSLGPDKYLATGTVQILRPKRQ